MNNGPFRLLTRSDFDGLVCAVLLEELDMIDDIEFVHPKEMQDGTVLVSDRDITTNPPYVRGVHLAFDHHLSEIIRLDEIPDNYVIDATAPSAARVVYEHFGGKDGFPNVSDDLMAAVDKSDSGQFDESEIRDPREWVLLNFLMDPRTGLGRVKDFRVSNRELMRTMITACRTHDIDEILALPDVKERVVIYEAHQENAEYQIKRCTAVHGNVGVLDYRGEEEIFATNRFLVYALFPEINISIHVLAGREHVNTILAVGKSVLNRTSKTNVGALMLEHGGGGHESAGTCQIEDHEADQVLAGLVERIGRDG